jgi:CheY-like chemotaxis protein
MARYYADMKDLKILLSANKGPLFEQATKAFAKGRYEITTAARPTLKSVIKKVELEKPDVIVLDVSMPSLSGKGVFGLLRQQFPDTPVILEMTAMTMRRSMNLVRLADDVVVEPYKPAELRMRVDSAVAARARLPLPPVVAELHDPATGRIDAKKLADYLGIPLASLAIAIGKEYKAVFKTPASEPLQPALAPIHRTVMALHRYFGHRNESLAWLNTANPELDAKRPKDLVLEGKAEIVADMLEGALAGVTA